MMIWFAAMAAALAVWWLIPGIPLTRLRDDPVAVHAAALRRRLRARLPARLGVWGRRRSEEEDAVRASMPGVCDLMAVCLDAGLPPRAALRVVVAVGAGDAREVLVGVLHRIDLGGDEAEAWAGLADVPGFREVGRDLARSVRSGVGLSSLLRQHARDARAAAAAAALVRARAAGVRSVVPMMLCFLPAFLLLGVVPIFGSLMGSLAP